MTTLYPVFSGSWHLAIAISTAQQVSACEFYHMADVNKLKECIELRRDRSGHATSAQPVARLQIAGSY